MMKKLLFFFALLLPIGAWASKIPYAVYNNGTLTFKYGEFTPNGITSWDVSNTGSQPFLSNDLSWDGNLKYVVFESSFSEARPKSCFGWFDACKGLESIVGLEYLNTSEVTTMACMFELCPKLKSINLSHFNTSKVTDMKNMFAGTTGITTLDLSSFNTSKVTNMDYMFDSSQNESPDGINWLRVIYVGNNWSTASVISGTHMFDHCGNLSGGNGTRWSSDHIDYTYACIDTPNTPGYLTMVDNISYEGNGTKEDPWLISSVDELRAIHFPGYYKLTKDIDMTEWIDSNSPVNGWPGFVRQYISGIIFDGDNHRITGLWGKRDNFMYGNGLFPQLQDSTIKNLYVEVQKGKSLSGVSEISILTTFIFKNGIIENVKVKGKLELAGTYICPSGGVGGLGSSISNSKIINSEAEVEISDNNPENDSETDYGLLAGSVISGENGESIITGCRASGKISSSWSLATIGGLVGFSTATITKCSSSVSIYSTGDDSFAGGLIGADNLSGGSANISLCSAEGVIYVHGKKSGTFQFGCQAGGLVGYLKGSVTDCTSNVDVMGTDYIGGVVGYCSGGNIRNCLTTGNLFSRAEQSNIGGIVGYIQGNPVINGNVALVRSIDAPAASPDYVWKIAGRVHESTLFPASNVNYALTDMIITTKNGRKVDTNIRYDGISATAEDLHKQGAYIALGWDFDNNWQMAPYNLPEIRSLATPNTIIEFADANVKALCVSMWDTNNDGEISRTEAAAVTDLGEVFKGNRDIIHFDELRFFTGIKEMPEWGTFADCENLYSITIPASVNSLGGATFANCRNLEEINVDTRNSVYDSRLGCNAIIETATNTLVVGGPRSNMYNVKTIGPASFWGRNVPILDYVIPETVTSIGANAFTWSSIEEFSMPTTIEDIGFQAFGYTPLKSITLPSSLSTLGEEAFRNCEEMTSVTIPDNLEEIPDSCFKYCTKLESIDLKNVKKIGGGAFGSTGLTSLVLPASVKEVCHEAFCGCPITTLDLGQVEKVGDAAFIGTAMEELTIPATLIEAGAETFSWNFSMKKAIFQDGCTKVFDTMFHGNENLSEVVLPNTITEIQDRAFRACKSLSTVAWPNKLERIGEQAFQESGITSAVLPQTMKWIGNEAFNKCQELVDVDIAYIEYLGYGAFSECPKIKKICLPSTIVLDEYSWGAFAWDSGLEEIEFFDGTTRIDNLAFIGCENLKRLPYGLPSTLESIGGGAFEECRSLESITIPNRVTLIGGSAFRSCSGLTSVTIGSGIEEIEENAFANCPKLTDVYCYAENVPSTDSKVFEGTPIEYATLHVPKGCLDAYQAVEPWRSFKNRVEIEDAKVKLSKTKAVIEKGKTLTLKATVTPETLTDKSVTWESSDTKVATVTSAGKVKGVKTGTATITCTSNSTGAKATCKVTVGSVKFDQTEIVVEKTKTKTLTATVYPSTLTDKSVTWESSDTKIATVTSAGKVKGVKTGTATITCTSNATGLSTTCKVTVGSVKLDQTVVSVEKGKTVTLKATVYPSTLEDKTVTWTSSNTSVATVSSKGKVKGVRTGTATITCTSNATGLSATCEVTVGSVKLDQTEIVVEKTKTKTLTATVYPSTLTDKSVTWTSSNTAIATVSSKGKVKGVKTGTAIITCTSNATGLSATCEVTVGSVKLDQTEVSVKKGKTVTLKATVYPSTLADKSVTWKSSNKSIATVTTGGKVKGVKAGTAKITCTSVATGLSTTCIVTVTGSASTRSLEGDDDELTGIDEIQTSVAVEPFDVYDLSGRKVRHQVTSLDGLPDGIYIVSGKKVLKKNNK